MNNTKFKKLSIIKIRNEYKNSNNEFTYITIINENAMLYYKNKRIIELITKYVKFLTLIKLGGNLVSV